MGKLLTGAGKCTNPSDGEVGRDTPGKPTLSRQYHLERMATVTVAAAFIFYRIVGVLPGSVHPVIDWVKDNQPDVLPFVGLAALLYLIYRVVFEWSHASHETRSMAAARLDLRITIAIALIALVAIIWPYADKLGFVGSTAGYAALLLCLGTCHGAVLHVVTLMPFLVRPRGYAMSLGLPRVPTVVRIWVGSLAVLTLMWVFLLMVARSLRSPVREWWVLFFFLLGTLAYVIHRVMAVRTVARFRGIGSLLRRYLEVLRGTSDFIDAALMLDGRIQREPRIMTPIHLAAADGNTDKVVAELNNGADPDSSGNWGWTPLLYAAAEGRGRVVRLLLSRAANPNIGNLFGRTPLMFAAKYGFGEIVSKLIENSADPNIQATYDGRSALMDAAEAGNTAILDELLGHGANPELRDHQGLSALDYAVARQHGKCAARLRSTQSKEGAGQASLTPRHFTGAIGRVVIDGRKRHPRERLDDMRKALSTEREALIAGSRRDIHNLERLLLVARDTYERLDVRDHVARVNLSLGQLYMNTGRYSQAVARLTEAQGDLLWLENDSLPHVFFTLGWSYMQLKNVSEALSAFKACVRECRGKGRSDFEASAYNNMGILYRAKGRIRASISCYQRALRLQEVRKDRAEQANILRNIGNLFTEQRNKTKARHYYERSLAMATLAGDQMLAAMAGQSLGRTYLPQPRRSKRVILANEVNMDHLNIAQRCFRTSIEAAHSARALTLFLDGMTGLATVALYRGDMKEALTLHLCVREIAEQSHCRRPGGDAEEDDRMIAQFEANGIKADEVDVEDRLKQWKYQPRWFRHGQTGCTGNFRTVPV